jgi:tRNA(fMet)-specific endonuclease VapC
VPNFSSAQVAIMILIDSDHLSVMLELRDGRRERLLQRLREAPVVCSVPIVVVEEHLRSWLSQVRRTTDVHRQVVPYLRLAKLIDYLRSATIMDWNEPAADHFERLRAARVRIGTQDLKIASIALAHDALLLSANLHDFEQVPRLRVEDWLQ